MKTLKYIGFSLLSLSIIFVAFGLFQDKEVSVSRSIVVNAPIDNVFDQFNDLNKRLLWSPWEAQDSTMVTTIGEIDKGVGASYSWTSEGSGEGSISYSEVVANQLIESKLQFGSPDEEPAQGLMIFEEVEDGVKVTWEVHMDMGNNPVMRIVGRYMDEMVGSTFEAGLDEMKSIVENEKPMINVSLIEVTSVPYISVLDSCSTDEMSERIGANYATLGAYLGANNLAPAGYPRITMFTWNPPSLVSFEQMFVLSEFHESSDANILSGMTYGGKVIMTTHLGSYETSGDTWQALETYMIANNMEMNGAPWEEYENSPRDQPDPNKLITNIYMPIK